MRAPLHDRERGHKKAPTGIKWGDEARFIRTWLERPRAIGAVSPSSRALSRAMAAEVDPRLEGPVIELGPGTGPVTEALIRHGVPAERLVLVEFDPAFCALLKRRYPACTVVHGDAYALGRTLNGLLADPAAAVVSGLPLLNRPERQRLALLADAFALMRPEAPFIQFTYGVTSPIPRSGPGVRFHAHGSAPVWLNLPPARVWVYRAAAERGDATASEPQDLFMGRLKARSSEARAEWAACAARVREGLERHKARFAEERLARAHTKKRIERPGDRPHW